MGEGQTTFATLLLRLRRTMGGALPGRGVVRFYRYSRWDGTQAVEPFTANDVMQHLADKMLDDGDLWSALREMLQRGANFQSGRQMPGLRDLLDRLRQQRQQQLQRYNLGSVMDDIKERLEQVVQTEREGIDRRLSE